MENGLVVKHNDLITARYDLNLVEQKIILYAVTKIDTNKEKFNIINIKVQEVAELMESESIRRYSEFRNVANGLMDRKVYLKDRPNLDVRWLASSEYVGNGVIELEFSEKLIPYLLQLKKRFTRYELKNILYLKNKHSIRIYELMKQYENIGKRKFELEEFKKLLMIEGQYERVYDLDRFVLNIAADEINKSTDININFKKIKKGRKVVGLLFTIDSKNKDEKVYIEFLNEFYDIKDMKLKMGLKDEKFNAEQIIKIYEKAVEMLGETHEDEIDIFEYVRLNYLEMKRTKGVRNPFGYLLDALARDKAGAKGQISIDHYIYPEDKRA